MAPRIRKTGFRGLETVETQGSDDRKTGLRPRIRNTGLRRIERQSIDLEGSQDEKHRD